MVTVFLLTWPTGSLGFAQLSNKLNHAIKLIRVHTYKDSGIRKENRQMSPWPLSLESYGPFIKRLGHQGKSMGQGKNSTN